MSKSQRIYALLGLLAVICVLTFAVSRYETKKEEIRNSDEIVLAIPYEDVVSLSWDNQDGEYSFTKDGGAWGYDADPDFPVDEEKMEDMLEQFADFKSAFIIENADDISRYGLDDPEAVITIGTASGSYEIKLGDYSTMDSQRYVSTGDGNVYLAAHDPMDEYSAVYEDLIDNDDNPVIDSVLSIEFSGTESYRITYAEESADTYCVDDVYFADTGGKNSPLDTSLVDNYLKTVEGLDLTDFVTYKASDAELAACGLDAPEVTVTIEYTEEDEEGKSNARSFVLHVSRDPDEAAKAAKEARKEESGETYGTGEAPDAEEEEESITAYARVGDSPIIYSITADSYRTLTASGYNDLRHKEVLTCGFADINKIDIELEGSSCELTRDKEADDEHELGTWSYNGSVTEVDGLSAALLNISADEFTDAAPSGREEISVTVHLDNDSFPEISITLYRVDGEYCLAQVDGSSFALVPRSEAVELIEAVNAIIL